MLWFLGDRARIGGNLSPSEGFSCRMNLQLIAVISILLPLGAEACLVPQDYEPPVAEASNEGKLAIPRFRVPKGMTVSLAAAEPLVANPVAFHVDSKGRVFVCETFRQQKGVEDNRYHMGWLNDCLLYTSPSPRDLSTSRMPSSA